MDGLLDFPVATAPAPGEVIPIAPGVLVARMRLPFALNHINLWLIEDGPALDRGRYRLHAARDAGGVAAHLRRRICAAGRSGGSSSPISTPTISAWPAG